MDPNFKNPAIFAETSEPATPSSGNMAVYAEADGTLRYKNDVGIVTNLGNTQTTYTTVNANSARWSSAYTTTSAQSANNASVFTTVQSNSASWGGGGTIDTGVRALTGNWQSTYTTVQSNSASWGGGSATAEVIANDVAITNNSVFQDITNMSFTAAANTAYLIRINFAVTTSATSTGYEIGLNGPASPTNYFSIVSIWNSATAETATITDSTSYGSIASNANAGGATARPAIGTILFRNGANAGTVQLQGKVETGVTGTVTFLADSFITWEVVSI